MTGGPAAFHSGVAVVPSAVTPTTSVVHQGVGSITHGLSSGAGTLAGFVPVALLEEVGVLLGVLVVVAGVVVWAGLRRPVRR